MVEWCRANLAPHAPGFEFLHHDVRHESLNANSPGHRELPIQSGEVTLFIAWSVFTHLLEEDAAFYLLELARVLSTDGVAITTWFTFDKSDFPMMQDFQNALFINHVHLNNAVIFDRGWLSAQTSRLGLVMTRITPPAIRGYQWRIHFQKQTTGRLPANFPEDSAPRGIARAYAGQATALHND